MPVLFGDVRLGDGKIKVWRTLHQVEGKPVNPKDYPEGYEFEAMPEFPAPEPGVSHTWLYDPEAGEHSFEEEARPWTPEEIMQHRFPQLEDRLMELEKATGVGQPGEKGIAQRMNVLEDRIKRLEDQA